MCDCDDCRRARKTNPVQQHNLALGAKAGQSISEKYNLVKGLSVVKQVNDDDMDEETTTQVLENPDNDEKLHEVISWLGKFSNSPIYVDTADWDEIPLKDKVQRVYKAAKMYLPQSSYEIWAIVTSILGSSQSFTSGETRKYINLLHKLSVGATIANGIANIFRKESVFKVKDEISEFLNTDDNYGNNTDGFPKLLRNYFIDSLDSGIIRDARILNVTGKSKKLTGSMFDGPYDTKSTPRYYIELDIPKWKGTRLVLEFDPDEEQYIRYYYARTKSGRVDHADVKDMIIKTAIDHMIENTDMSKSLIQVEGAEDVNILERKFNSPVNKVLPISGIVNACTKVLNEGRRRGIAFIGEPGTGKTSAMNRIISEIPDCTPIMISAVALTDWQSFNLIKTISKNVTKPVIILDDFDSLDTTDKDETTQLLLDWFDNKVGLTCAIILASINNPRKVNMAIINRPERIDDVFYVGPPEHAEDIVEVLNANIAKYGYDYTISEDTHADFIAEIIENKLTHAHIGAIIQTCHDYYCGVNTDTLAKAFESRKQSIHNARLVANVYGELDSDYDDDEED